MNYSLLRSKTFWSIAAMFVVGGLNAIVNFIPANAQVVIQAILGIAASYFHSSTAKEGNVTN